MSLKLNYSASRINEILASAFTKCSVVQTTTSCMLNFGKLGATIQSANAARYGVMTPQHVSALNKATADVAATKAKVDGLSAVADSAWYEDNNDGGTIKFLAGSDDAFEVDIPGATNSAYGLMGPSDRRKMAHVTLTYDAEAVYGDIRPESTPAPYTGVTPTLVVDVIGKRLLVKVDSATSTRYFDTWTKDEYGNRNSDYVSGNVIIKAEGKEYTYKDGAWIPKSAGVGVYWAVRVSGVSKADEYIASAVGQKGTLGLDVADGKLFLAISGQRTTRWTASQSPDNLSNEEYYRANVIINCAGTLYGCDLSKFVH